MRGPIREVEDVSRLSYDHQFLSLSCWFINRTYFRIPDNSKNIIGRSVSNPSIRKGRDGSSHHSIDFRLIPMGHEQQ